ncbi:hypothetical protein [Candidimonas nitroreducens]|uniref:Uncharacterized protein n=1 Tax=Candidimonas nitroreducens TaxID=683354 RepID=A0A225M8J8_9BURK|nr:hypothetical protein [Candidimonas nitroreducens]OWT55279.1 hypothetical protein CEY11_21455 [Candidimonas nitroreducens]
MNLVWDKFSGIRPRVDQRMLPDGNAQVADNVNTEHGGISPIEGTADILALAKTGVQTIYRFGQALASATQYWFCWTIAVDVVKGPIANDTAEFTAWTGDGVPKYTRNDIGTAGSDLPSASRPLAVPAPTMAPTLSAVGDPPVGAGSETREYIYTFKNEDRREGPPSLPATLDIVIGQGVQLDDLETAATNGAVLGTKCIYRAQAGVYIFVDEIPIAQTSYTDTIDAADLGDEVCPSINWDTPPDTMFALTAGPNGMMAAADGYDVLFCVPFYPQAWPGGYRQTVNFPVVGLGWFATTLVVLTTGQPFLMTGTDPANISVSPAKFFQPCVSKASIVATAGGDAVASGGDVVWASPEGLCSIGPAGEQVLTQGLFTTKQWEALHPETIIGCWHQGWYIGTYDPGSGRRAFRFSPTTQEWTDMPDTSFTAMYRDTVSDKLYVCVGDHIHEFRGGDPLAYTWHSQQVVTPLYGVAAGRVTGDYPVTFKLFADGTLMHTETVQSDEPFILPDRLARSWEIELSGTSRVLRAAVSDSIVDL